MRQPYSHEYERFVDKFKNTACYTQLTSRILSAARGGEYYGPPEGLHTGRWQYQPRDKCKCRNKKLCDAIRQDLYVATTKSSCLIQDHATAWYGEQKRLRQLKQTLSSMSPQELKEFQCRYYANFQFQSPPNKCLQLKMPIRSVPCLLPAYQVSSSTKRISKEFLELLKQHDARQREKSDLYCLPSEYTRRRVKTGTKEDKENVPSCLDGRPCYCDSNSTILEAKKTDTHKDRHRSHKRGFIAKWCFCSQDQKYPAEDKDYYCRQGSQRSLMHYARSQPRIKLHESCPTEPCSQDTCAFQCKERPRVIEKSSSKIAKPRAHGYVTEEEPIANRVGTSLAIEPDLRPRLKLQNSVDSVQEIWTKPNATQMRESCSSLRPRYFVPKVSKKYVEPAIADKCLAKRKPPPVPPKPRSYVLGKRLETAMTKPPKRPLKRKHSCMRIEKVPSDMTPRYRIQDECPIIEEKPVEDKTCYPHLMPRYIPQGPRARKFDSSCWRRVTTPPKDPKPKWMPWPKTKPEFHDDNPSCKQLRRRQHVSRERFSETRPRFHDQSSDTSPQNFRKRRGILKKPSSSCSQNSLAFKAKTKSRTPESDSSPITCKRNRYLSKRKPNADADTSDDTDIDRKRRLPLCTLPNAHMPRVKSSQLQCIKTSQQKAQQTEFVKLGKCRIPLRPPTAPSYKAPVHILKGHETCYKDASHWFGVSHNYPQTYLGKAKQNRKDMELGRKQRLRMWSTKECPKPKYAPASKCQTALKIRCPSKDPHKALYTAKKRLTTRDASPYHITCYKSSSGGESECTFMGRKLRR